MGWFGSAVDARRYLLAFCIAAPLAAQEPPQARAIPVDTFTTFGPVYFDRDRAAIRPDAVPYLERILRWLRANPGMRFRVEGHSDERGTDEYNLTLSARRTGSAVRWFASHGIAASRFETIARGETRPMCNEPEEGCWKLKRRADFRILTLGSDTLVSPDVP